MQGHERECSGCTAYCTTGFMQCTVRNVLRTAGATHLHTPGRTACTINVQPEAHRVGTRCSDVCECSSQDTAHLIWGVAIGVALKRQELYVA